MYVSGLDLFGEDSVFANEGATLGVWDGGRADVCLFVCLRRGGTDGGLWPSRGPRRGEELWKGKGAEGFDAVSEKRMVWREGGGLVEMQS